MSMPVFWLGAIVLFLAVEALIPGLISIWFAFGALAALICSLFNAPIWLQIVWFLLVSVAALVATRPLAQKYVNSQIKPTNADMLIGRECFVEESINNLFGTGSVSIDGKVWSARGNGDTQMIPTGTLVRVLRIDGVKLIVEESQIEEKTSESKEGD